VAIVFVSMQWFTVSITSTTLVMRLRNLGFLLITCTGSSWHEAKFLHSSPYGAVFQTGDQSNVASTSMFWLLLNSAYTVLGPSVSCFCPCELTMGGQEAEQGHSRDS